MSTYSISKTSFLKFEQCQKAFFLYKNHPYLRDKVSVDKQLTFKRGHDVGYFAQQLFPGGIDISKETKNVVQALELTATHIETKTPVIYEATFVHNGVLVMADILTLNEGVYNAYEIKSSLKVSETYLKDAYMQYFVIKKYQLHRRYFILFYSILAACRLYPQQAGSFNFINFGIRSLFDVFIFDK